MKKVLLGVLVAASTIPGAAPASAEPCVVWDPPPPQVEPECTGIQDTIADATAGLDPITCGAIQTAGTPALVNTLAPTFAMDVDDCDLYVNGERFIDFVPYED